MRYAVISDIHSNIEALSAFLKAVGPRRVDRIICLGDIVGYNANPNECIRLIRDNGIQCVMGNHDSRVAGFEEPVDFNYHAAAAVYWTRDALDQESREFLEALPRRLVVDRNLLAVHGWVNDTDRYILGAKAAEANFGLMAGESKCPPVCFFGHTHVPVAYLQDEGGHAQVCSENPLKLRKGARYLINPGALGQPRDRDPRAAFLIYDSAKAQVTFYRVEYDIAATADKILSAGLPERLAERLRLGW